VHEVVHLHSHAHSIEAHGHDVLGGGAVVTRSHVRLECILRGSKGVWGGGNRWSCERNMAPGPGGASQGWESSGHTQQPRVCTYDLRAFCGAARGAKAGAKLNDKGIRHQGTARLGRSTAHAVATCA
jgi:hypothetical protein